MCPSSTRPGTPGTWPVERAILTGATDDAISVHAYSPPLWRLGQYDLSADGILRRTSISYADELRPVGTSASISVSHR